MNPVYSVVIPSHGRLSWLREALASVFAQTATEWECLVVSDLPEAFATTRRVVEHFQDPRARFLPGDRPGANASRNKGMDHARGSILCFLDDDDLWEPEKLSKHGKAHLSADMVYSATYSRHDKPFVYDLFKEKKGLDGSGMLREMRRFRGCPQSASCCSLRRDALGNVRWDENLSSFQDFDFWLQILLSAPKSVAHLAEPLAVIREHTGTRTSVGLEKRLANIRVIAEKYPEVLSPGAVRWRIQQERYLYLRTLAAQGQRRKAVQEAIRQRNAQGKGSPPPLGISRGVRALLTPSPKSRLGLCVLLAWYRVTRRKHAFRRLL